MMVLGIKERGTEATRILKGVFGWRQHDGYIMVDMGNKQLTYYIDDVVCSAPSDGFDRSRMKPFIKEGYSEKEMCQDVEL